MSMKKGRLFIVFMCNFLKVSGNVLVWRFCSARLERGGGEGGYVSQDEEEGCGSDEWFLLPIPG